MLTINSIKVIITIQKEEESLNAAKNKDGTYNVSRRKDNSPIQGQQHIGPANNQISHNRNGAPFQMLPQPAQATQTWKL